MGLRGESGKTLERLYYKLSPHELQFVKVGEKYRAAFEMTILFFDSKGREVGGDVWTRQLWVNSYEESQNSEAELLDSVSFMLAPGAHKTILALKDLDSQRWGRVEKRIEVPDLAGPAPRLSDLRIELERGDGGGTRVNPARVYDERQKSLIVAYVLYAYPKSQLDITAEVRAAGGRVPVLKQSDVVRSADSASNFELRFPLQSLSDGEYTVVVRATDLRTRTVVERSGTFAVKLSFLSAARDLREALDQVSYIATNEERDELRSAKGTERAKVWADFWKRRDPTPGTALNEAEEEFNRRIKYAGEHYSDVRPGWRTDRGRIYIKFGVPDDVERHPFDLDRPASEVWFYYAKRLQFVFVDRFGGGDYLLDNPTAEDEKYRDFKQENRKP
jgi:GWxTD domain-containing protein